MFLFFFSSRRRHTRFSRDWSSDVCSSDLSLQKQFKLLSLILKFNELGNEAITDGKSYKNIENLSVRERIGRFKYVEEKDIDKETASIIEDMETEFSMLTKE